MSASTNQSIINSSAIVNTAITSVSSTLGSSISALYGQITGLSGLSSSLSSNINTSMISVSASINAEIVQASNQNVANGTNVSQQISSIENSLVQYAGSSQSNTGINTAYGALATDAIVGSGNIGVGASSAQTTVGNINTATGSSAGISVTGNSNTGIGSSSERTVTGSLNTAAGALTGDAIVGNANTGAGSLSSILVTGSGNSALGLLAGSNLTGNANTFVGQTAGQSATGNTNTGFGAGAGIHMTGNGNIAFGESAGTIISSASPIEISPSAAERFLESVASTDVSTTGYNNIAIGSYAGLNNGGQKSDTVAVGSYAAALQSGDVALGASAAATQASSVALGANATSIAENSVAIGAYSVANAKNTVSIGAPDNARSLVNVAPGINTTDVATYGQLNATSNALAPIIQRQGLGATAGIAMSMAQAGAIAGGTSGQTNVAIGTAYFAGQSGIGVGFTSASKSASRIIRVASAISPGFGNIAVQADMQFKLGRNHGTASDSQSSSALSPHQLLQKYQNDGLTSITTMKSGYLYQAELAGKAYRFTIGRMDSASESAWFICIDQRTKTRAWKRIALVPNAVSENTFHFSLERAITEAIKFNAQSK